MLYRAGHQVEAVEIAEAVDGGRGMKHVLAQAVGLGGFGYVDIGLMFDTGISYGKL